MGDRPTSMLLFVVLVFVAIVQSLPLSDKLYGTHNDHGNPTNAGSTSKDTPDKYPPSPPPSHTHQEFDDKDTKRYPSTGDQTVVEEVQQQAKVNISLDGSLRSDYEKSNDTTLGDISDMSEHSRHRRSGNPFQNSHVIPCSYSDRHYCLNAGTCVLVAALDIKTCRCEIPYTGIRCEMIDVDYLMTQMNTRMSDEHRTHFSFGWHG
ncbi:pro-neuregulin-3, membrane-bound isoform-like isoform X2 [Mizuhopecten yessoensis]|nr:pro-neuregulin-3, membrane-bound isoform-like isoform X2 [Mizuhopecten yessoensis]XP_021343058.1 pro-neuregulin-3, membrane-bound isoform-like isoform X2 [Mizuhopecten yessoensis]